MGSFLLKVKRPERGRGHLLPPMLRFEIDGALPPCLLKDLYIIVKHSDNSTFTFIIPNIWKLVSFLFLRHSRSISVVIY